MKKVWKCLMAFLLVLMVFAPSITFVADAATYVKITKQPASVKVLSGKKASVTVKASGKSLTYKWYYKDKGQSKFKAASVTKNTYSVTMSSSVDGRQVYCVVTDKYSKTATTKTVTLSMAVPVKITAQPTSVAVKSGVKASVKVAAAGDGLTYKWYYKNKGQSKFKATSVTKETYSATMSSSVNGRQVYCVVKDQYGKTATTKTVTLSLVTPLKITTQPTSVKVLSGTKTSVKVTAAGDGLTYKWYYKNKGQTEFKATSVTKDTYALTMSSTYNGRQVYCVITDKYGKTATTKTVTFTMAQAVKITTQPVSAKALNNTKVSVKVTASGDGLTYKWYYKNKNQSKFTATSVTKDTYSATMNSSVDGRQLYCVVKDQYGKTATTKTITISLGTAVKITKQPVSASAQSGEKASVKVTASGDGLTYKWYYKNKGQTKFTATSVTTATYSTTMSSSVDGRQVYCVVKDQYGKTATSSTVTLTMVTYAKITQQPTSVSVQDGEKATVTVSAIGDGLSYKWYYQNKGQSKFTATSVTKDTYSVTMSSSVDGRMVYCAVTDKYGNTVKSNAVTLSMKVAPTGPVKLTIGIPASATVLDYDNNALTKWIEEECNVNLNIILYSGGSDVSTQIATTIAAGQDLPDILYGINLGERVVSRYGENGYLADLKTYFADSTGASKTFWTRMNQELSAEDRKTVINKITEPGSGAIYGVPYVEKNPITSIQSQAWINQAWLDRLGLEMPTNLGELYEVLKAFKTKDPNGNGIADEIPVFGSQLVNGSKPIDWLMNMFCYYNAQTPYTVGRDGKLTPVYTTDSYREGLKFISQLYKEGILSGILWTAGSSELKIISTPASGTAICGIFFGNLSTATTKDSSVLYEYASLPYFGNAMFSDITCNMNTFITGDCDNVDKAFEVLMKLWSLDGSLRVRYGEYGVNWTNADAGATSEIGQKATFKLLNDPLQQQNTAHWRNVASTLLVNETAQVSANGTEWELYKRQLNNSLYTHYNAAQAWQDNTLRCPALKFTEDEQEDIEVENMDVSSYWTRSRDDFCMGRLDPYNDKDWSDYLQQLNELGLQKVLSTAQTAYNRAK